MNVITCDVLVNGENWVRAILQIHINVTLTVAEINSYLNKLNDNNFLKILIIAKKKIEHL